MWTWIETGRKVISDFQLDMIVESYTRNWTIDWKKDQTLLRRSDVRVRIWLKQHKSLDEFSLLSTVQVGQWGGGWLPGPL